MVNAFHRIEALRGILTVVVAVSVTCDLSAKLPLLHISVEKRRRPALNG